jgi:DnaJ-class molecular chaperone
LVERTENYYTLLGLEST